MLPNGWKRVRLSDLTTCTAGGTPSTRIPEYWGGKIRWMSSGELNLKKVRDVEGRITESGLKNSSTKMIPAKCVLIGLAGQGKTRGTAAINYVPLCTNQSVAAIFPADSFVSEFIYYNLDSRYEELRSLSTGDGGRGGLNLGILNNLQINLPPIVEQVGIINILENWDSGIERLQNLIVQKQEQKNALMQRLLTGKHRFPEFEGKWRNVLLGDVTIESTKRNNNSTLDDVRAVNKTHGMIPMKEETIGNSLERYKVVEDKDFAYNPMRINIGSICRWEEKSECLVSPDYVVFRVKEGALDSDYLSHFRNSHRWAVFMEQAGAGGVRIRIYYKDLASMIIPLPPTIAEQKKIAAVLNAADKEIDLLNQKLEAYQEQKKGLMQQLLTGKKRVKITRKEAA